MATPDNSALRNLDSVRKQIASQASKIKFGSLLTLILGLVAMGMLGLYFNYGYNQISEISQPDQIAGAVQTLVDDNIPSLRTSVETEIAKQAPSLAQTLSERVRNGVPTAREKLEDYVVEQMKTVLDQGTVLTNEQITTFLKNNKDKLRKDAQDLAKNPQLAEEAINDLQKALEEQLGQDLKSQAMELMAALNATNDKMERLMKNENLNETEKLERRLIQIARRLQSEQVPGGTGVPAAGSN